MQLTTAWRRVTGWPTG